MLSEATILDLKTILLEEFGYEYSKEEASNIATSLVKLIEALSEINNKKICQNVITPQPSANITKVQ